MSQATQKSSTQTVLSDALLRALCAPLIEKLKPAAVLEKPIVYGLVESGEILGEAIARQFDLPFEVGYIRPLLAPDTKGVVLGAVSGTTDVACLDEERIASLGSERETVYSGLQELKLALVREAVKGSRGGEALRREVGGRTVFLVDSVIDSPWKFRAAVQTLCQCGAALIVPVTLMLYRKAVMGINGSVRSTIALREFHDFESLRRFSYQLSTLDTESSLRLFDVR